MPRRREQARHGVVVERVPRRSAELQNIAQMKDTFAGQ